MMRQKGEHAVRSGFNDVLSDAVCASVPAGSAEEQAAAAEMLQFDPARAMSFFVEASIMPQRLLRIPASTSPEAARCETRGNPSLPPLCPPSYSHAGRCRPLHSRPGVTH